MSLTDVGDKGLQPVAREQTAMGQYLCFTEHSAVRVRVAGASVQAGHGRVSPALGSATLSLFQDKRIIVFTLVAAWHKDGQGTPRALAVLHAEDRVSLSLTAGMQEELGHAWPSLLLLGEKQALLSSGPSPACLVTLAFRPSVPTQPHGHPGQWVAV